MKKKYSNKFKKLFFMKKDEIEVEEEEKNIKLEFNKELKGIKKSLLILNKEYKKFEELSKLKKIDFIHYGVYDIKSDDINSNLKNKKYNNNIKLVNINNNNIYIIEKINNNNLNKIKLKKNGLEYENLNIYKYFLYFYENNKIYYKKIYPGGLKAFEINNVFGEVIIIIDNFMNFNCYYDLDLYYINN
jgi:hypothetical protein